MWSQVAVPRTAARVVGDGLRIAASEPCMRLAPLPILDFSMARVGRAALERDLYQHLLELGQQRDPGPQLGAILEVLVAAINAQRGYLELYPARGEHDKRWTITHGCTPDDENEIRSATSRGIVAATLATGSTLHVPHAALDDRFGQQPSVREQRLEAVLCIPLGPIASGVLYIEGKRGAGPFPDDDVRLVVEEILMEIPASSRTGAERILTAGLGLDPGELEGRYRRLRRMAVRRGAKRKD